MRRKLIVSFLLMVIPCFAQQGSNLFQIISSDLPIERNISFRELQTMLENENAKELKGIDLSILHTMIDGYKNEILKFVQPLQITVEENDYTLRYRDNPLISIRINNNQTIQELLLKWEPLIEKKLSEYFVTVSDKFLPGNKRVANILFFVGYTIIYQGEVKKFNYIDSVDYKNLTAALITSDCSSNIRTALTGMGMPIDKPIGNISGEYVKKFNAEFIELANNLNDEIVNEFNLIHTTITNEVEKPLNQNLKGITGFSAAHGSGIFTGGIMYSLSGCNGAARLSFYSNANFNAVKDTADSVAHSLFGIRGAYIAKNYQLDFLFSIFFGDKQFNKFEVFEFGVGFNYCFDGGSILGIAGFYTDNGTDPKLSAYSLGVMFKISQEAPIVIAGFSALKNSSEKRPILQITYPINVGL